MLATFEAIFGRVKQLVADFLRCNERAVLPDAGRVTRKAEKAFDLFEQRRRAEIEAKAGAELMSQIKSLARRTGRGRKPKKRK